MTVSQALRERLLNGMEVLGLPGSEAQTDDLLAFLVLMQKWNRTYNLTAIRDLYSGVDLHLLDSLAVLPYLRGQRILDVGTGAGLPGIPLAVMSEGRQFVLLDSSSKKIRFVRQAVMELRLSNVETMATRIEAYQPSVLFDVVVTRAFASLDDIRLLTERLLVPGGVILALKGRMPEHEMAAFEAEPGFRVHRLLVPGVEAERCLIEMAAIQGQSG